MSTYNREIFKFYTLKSVKTNFLKISKFCFGISYVMVKRNNKIDIFRKFFRYIFNHNFLNKPSLNKFLEELGISTYHVYENFTTLGVPLAILYDVTASR